MEQLGLIALGVFMFTAIILALVVVILVARSRLVASGEIEIIVNDQKHLKAMIREPSCVSLHASPLSKSPYCLF